FDLMEYQGNNKLQTAVPQRKVYDVNSVDNMLEDFNMQVTPTKFVVEGENFKTSPAKSTFHDRQNRGKTLVTLNPNLGLSDNIGVANSPCVVTILPKQQLETYRYMHQTLNEKYEVLIERMENLAEVIAKHYEIEITDPSSLNQSETSTVGRICCDSEGKLNQESVTLESLPYFGGKKVKLAINNLSSYALFPGQIVGIQGINNFGSELNVTKILEIPLLPMCRTPSDTIMDYYGPSKLNGRPLNVVISSGPYMLDIEFKLEPLRELLNKMSAEKPDVLILMGPFVDEDHPLIQAGEVNITPGEIFSRKIAPMLLAFVRKSPNVKLIMIPSVKDICHDHIAFPQPPWDKSGIPESIICLPNPVQFKVNEVVFAIGNVDILCHLFQEETESLYPLFPPSMGVNLDLKHSSSLDLIYTPDVLVLPSKLKYFAKVLDNVICVNPGYLAKGSNTYAKMVIHPFPPNLASEAEVEHFVYQRTRVDIVRI
ncbi:18778_t:CDS:10, partial [Acaulospora morrowiae]